MPDKRRKGATQYSTHPPTVTVRRRLAAMDGDKRTAIRARDAEYQSIWQAFDRKSRKEDYRRATVGIRKIMLTNMASGLMEKR